MYLNSNFKDFSTLVRQIGVGALAFSSKIQLEAVARVCGRRGGTYFGSGHPQYSFFIVVKSRESDPIETEALRISKNKVYAIQIIKRIKIYLKNYYEGLYF